jgi:hypothetical protein
VGGNRKDKEPKERLRHAAGSEHAREADLSNAAGNLHGSEAVPGRRTRIELLPTGCSTAESPTSFHRAVTEGCVNPGPAQTNAAIPLAPVVYQAIERAQKSQRRLGDELGAVPGLAATLERSAQDGNTAVIRDALIASAATIGGFTAKIETKGQRDPASVTLDDLLKLLGDVFQSSELEAYGLPVSYGNQPAIEPLADEISEAFDQAVRSAVMIGRDAKAIKAAVATVIASHREKIEAAIEQVAGAWNDPMDLVDLELKGAITKLVALRGELAHAKTAPEQATIGGKIAHLARYVLLHSAG